MREKGAVRPLWLCLGVLTAVTAGTVVNKCWCGSGDDNSAKVSVVVRGDMINEAPKPYDPPAKPDENEANEEGGKKIDEPLPIEKEPEIVKDPKITKKDVVDDPLKRDAPRLKPEEIKKGFKELTFDTLADWEYVFPEMTDGKPSREDPTPEKIKKMSGKKFAIRGFMIPFKVDGEEVTEFLLVRNQFACCFGVVPKMNEWLHVKMEQGKKAPYAVDVPITVYGKLDAAELIEKGVVMSLYRMEASSVEEPPVFR